MALTFFSHSFTWFSGLNSFIGGPTKEMNIKVAAVFKSFELQTQEVIVFMVLNDYSHSAVGIISIFILAASG